MINEFQFEGAARRVVEKTSARGNEYWIANLDCGKDAVDFIFFKEKPVVGGVYRVIGHLTTNPKGFASISVDKTDSISVGPAAGPVQSQQQQAPPPQAAQDPGDDETPF